MSGHSLIMGRNLRARQHDCVGRSREEPCGTPALNLSSVDAWSSTTTCILRSKTRVKVNLLVRILYEGNWPKNTL